MRAQDDLVKEVFDPLNGRMLVCPMREACTSFQLVDECGDGSPYAGAGYEVCDIEGEVYRGFLNADGAGEVKNHCKGPIVLRFDSQYVGDDETYTKLQTRDHYPLKITEIQVRAEATRHLEPDGSRTRNNPGLERGDHFYQVEVRELVRHGSHLPPMVVRRFPPRREINATLGAHGDWGIGLMPGEFTVLEVRPLRALRPMLSTAPTYCVLNLYQLSLMATLSYSPFGQEPAQHPVMSPTVSFPLKPSMGNWFGEELATFKELWQVDAGQRQECFPLFEDVPYSERWEIVPFDPALYPVNDPGLGKDQENPASIHFLDDRGEASPTDTQAYITHNADVMIIAIRGTNELKEDALRDLDALQVPFEYGEGRVHRGFYEAALRAFDFAAQYIGKFHQSQQLFICGHSLGGAVALLLAEMLRRTDPSITLQLYTYGAPRAGDTTFMQGAAELVHYRMVYDDDPVPSLPAPWMNTRWEVVKQGLVLTLVKSPLGYLQIKSGLVNQDGERFEHHGELRHFMPVHFTRDESSAILWSPGCETLTEKALCSRVLDQADGLPDRGTLVDQVLKSRDHKMLDSYIPGCWATLRRYQQALQAGTAPIAQRELVAVQAMLGTIGKQIERHAALPQASAPYPRAHAFSAAQLEEERRRIEGTLRRLETLAHTPVSEPLVYGNLAGTDALAQALARWHGHALNNRAEQLAQAPRELPDSRRAPASGPSGDELLASLDKPWYMR